MPPQPQPQVLSGPPQLPTYLPNVSLPGISLETFLYTQPWLTNPHEVPHPGCICASPSSFACVVRFFSTDDECSPLPLWQQHTLLRATAFPAFISIPVTSSALSTKSIRLVISEDSTKTTPPSHSCGDNDDEPMPDVDMNMKKHKSYCFSIDIRKMSKDIHFETNGSDIPHRSTNEITNTTTCANASAAIIFKMPSIIMKLTLLNCNDNKQLSSTENINVMLTTGKNATYSNNTDEPDDSHSLSVWHELLERKMKSTTCSSLSDSLESSIDRFNSSATSLVMPPPFPYESYPSNSQQGRKRSIHQMKRFVNRFVEVETSLEGASRHAQQWLRFVNDMPERSGSDSMVSKDDIERRREDTNRKIPRI